MKAKSFVMDVDQMSTNEMEKDLMLPDFSKALSTPIEKNMATT